MPGGGNFIKDVHHIVGGPVEPDECLGLVELQGQTQNLKNYDQGEGARMNKLYSELKIFPESGGSPAKKSSSGDDVN